MVNTMYARSDKLNEKQLQETSFSKQQHEIHENHFPLTFRPMKTVFLSPGEFCIES